MQYYYTNLQSTIYPNSDIELQLHDKMGNFFYFSKTDEQMIFLMFIIKVRDMLMLHEKCSKYAIQIIRGKTGVSMWEYVQI